MDCSVLRHTANAFLRFAAATNLNPGNRFVTRAVDNVT